VHLVMENYGAHMTPTVKQSLARNPRFHVHFTPTFACWLNQVERRFTRLTVRQIRRGTHRSTVELERAIRDYLSVNNRDPKPFLWAKTAGPIIESIRRLCVRSSNFGPQHLLIRHSALCRSTGKKVGAAKVEVPVFGRTKSS
jgi:hypothetical protein